MCRKHLYLATTILVAGLSGQARCEESRVDYLKQIKPVLAERCFACHGALKQEGGLRLDTAALAKQGGESGAAIVPGDPAASILLDRITATEESVRMPAEGQPLKSDQIALIKSWINQQAEAPPDEQPERHPKDHWAFKPILRPPVPQATNATWIRNPIDAFVARQHAKQGLTPQREAAAEVLLRRVSLDLVGLPPTAEQLAMLETAGSGGWYEGFVEQLLKSPQHGERWARHWMDIWRYSDWWGLGGQVRNSHPHIWRWRDWIVESLNGNTRYDEMIRLMLAADELAPNDPEKLRATGFLARNWSLYGRNVWMEDCVEHVSKGFLGLTMNCAKCHDHKYDPIAQVDYYRMRAFFEPYHVRIDLNPGQTDASQDGVARVFDGWLDKPTYRFERGQEGSPDKSKVMSPGVPAMFAFKELQIKPVTLPKESWQPARRPGVIDAYIAAAKKNLEAAETADATVRTKLSAAQKQLADRRAAATLDKKQIRADEAAVADADAEAYVSQLALDIARTELLSVESRAAAMRAGWAKADGAADDDDLIEAERATSAEAIAIERRIAVAKATHALADAELRLRRTRDHRKAGQAKAVEAARESLAAAEQKAAAALTSDDQFTALAGAVWMPTRQILATTDDPPVAFPPLSSGRRTALADWITDRRNPLTARVAVNHIWARHMGAPLVNTMFDFGRKGIPPKHVELLDWLAAEFIESGWDMRHLHRLIVQSSTYRMSSSLAGNESDRNKDPENQYLWRHNPLRLESQAVRDSILSLAGKLDLTLGGPSLLPNLQDDSNRRSMYFWHSNNDRNLFLTTFDEAAVNECYRRDQNIIPQQALALSNSRLVLDAAKKITEELSKLSQVSDADFIRQSYYRLLGIRANDAEVAASTKAMEAWRKLPATGESKPVDRAREYFVWALLNHNDFVTVR